MLFGPDKEPLPDPYPFLISSGLTECGPWRLLTDLEESNGLRLQFRCELPFAPDCIPFARRRDCDDIAAIVINPELPHGAKLRGVFVDHLSWVTGPDPMAKPPGIIPADLDEAVPGNMWTWLSETVLPDMEEWGADTSMLRGLLIQVNPDFFST